MKLRRFLSLGMMSLLALTAMAEDRPLAFPGAEGYGRYATGGRGGKTYVVTSLEDCADNALVKGTFRWAVKQPGKKIVTFAVNGTIYLTSPLSLDCGDLTILGQTAPGEGICLADYHVTISCENAIIRYLRFRPGNNHPTDGTDGFGFEEANNVIMDHCSVSWSIDECLSISAATNLTIQWCMVEQALNTAGHSKGAHGYGGNWGGTNVSFHHNLITQCTSRVPRLGGDTNPETNDYCDLRNNVFYNWGGNGCYGAEAIDVNFVNNYYKPGPCTDKRGEDIRKRICGIGIRTNSYIKTYPAFAHDLHKWGHFYTEGNVNPDYADVTADNWTYGILRQVNSSECDGTWTATTKDTIHLKEPREFARVTTHTAELAYEKVLAYAGASLYRDCVDALMVAQVENRLGDQASGSNGAQWGQIDRPSDNKLSAADVEKGAWPILKAINRYTDADGDGIDDTAEDMWGLDSSDPTDGATLYTGKNANYKGYSYVEIFQDQSFKNGTKNITASCLADGTVMGVDEPTLLCLRRLPWEHEVSLLTYKGFDQKNQRQLFADDVYMSATGTLTGGAGQEQTIKFKSSRQYTIFVPSTIKAKAVRLYGYSNYGTDIYVSELNGKKYGSTDYVVKGADKAKQSITIPLNEEVSGKNLTITFSGDNQPCFRIYLVEEIHTSIKSMDANKTSKKAGMVYDLQGRHVANPTTGLYIINGKKTIVR